MSNIKNAIDAATAQAAAEDAAPPTLATAAFALADAAVTRETCKQRLIERREHGNTYAGGYEALTIAYKVAKRRYRACLSAYIAAKEASR